MTPGQLILLAKARRRRAEAAGQSAPPDDVPQPDNMAGWQATPDSVPRDDPNAFGAPNQRFMDDLPNRAGRFAKGAFDTVISGPFQLGANVGSAVSRGLGLGDPNQQLGDDVAQYQRNADASARAEMPQGDWDVAGGMGAMAGGAGALTGPMPAGLGARMMQGAKIGGVLGAMAPQQEAGLDKNMASAAAGIFTGGAIPLGLEGLNRLGKVLYHAGIEPLTEAGQTAIKGRARLEAAGDKAEEVAAALRAYQPAVPGSIAPAGEAAAPAGSTRYAAFQDEARNFAPDEYHDLAKSRDAARLGEIRSIGQDKQALADAVRARKAATAPLYEASDAQMIDDNPALRETLSAIPGSVNSRARRLAKMRGEPFSVGESKPEMEIDTGLLDSRGRPVTRTEEATTEQFPGKTLSYLQKALRAQQKDPTRGLSSHEQQAMAELDRELGGHLGDVYDAAESTYREMSRPVNQMRVGQFLEKKLTGALDEEAPNRATSFANAVREAPSTVRTQIGGPRMTDITEALTPGQTAKVNGVIRDLAGTAEYQRMVAAARGSGAGKAAGKAYSESVDATGHTGLLPPYIDAKVTLFNFLMRRLRGQVNDKLAKEIAIEMMNPQGEAQILENAIARRNNVQRLAAGLRSATTKGAALAGQQAGRLAGE